MAQSLRRLDKSTDGEGMPRYSLLLFDLDGVLCTNHRRRRCAYIGACAGLKAEEVEAAIWGSGIETLGDAGALDELAYLQAYHDALSYPLALDEWIDARRVATEPHHDVMDFVRELKGRVRLGVLTNNTTLIATHIVGYSPRYPNSLVRRFTRPPSSKPPSRTRRATSAAWRRWMRGPRKRCSSMMRRSTLTVRRGRDWRATSIRAWMHCGAF